MTELDTNTPAAAGDGPRVCRSCKKPVSVAASRFCGSCGARLDDGAPGAELVPVETDDGQAAESAGWWTRRKVIIVGLVVVVAAAGVGAYLLRQSTGTRAPEGPVLAFFDALADHDGPAAGEVLGNASTLDSGNHGDSPFWAEGALATGYQAPEHVKVTEVEHFTADDKGEMQQKFPGLGDEGVPKRPDMDSAVVTVSFTVGKADVEQQWVLLRETEGVERDYHVTNVDMGYIDIGVESTGATVAGVEAPGRVMAPPGVYDVAVKGDKLFQDTTGSLTVEPADSQSMTSTRPAAEVLDLEVRPEVAEEVDSQIRNRIKECLVTEDEYTTGADFSDRCPWVQEDLLDRERAPREEWTVTDWPRVSVAFEGSVKVETTHAGKATADYKNALGDKKTMEALLIPNGTVGVKDGEIVWTYMPDGDQD